MTSIHFPTLALADWQPTRDTITTYAQVVGKVRRALTPHQKHWWHISLHATATGLTTTPMPAGEITVEILLDFVRHALVITNSRGESWRSPLYGQSATAFCDTLMGVLAGMGIEPEIDRSLFDDETPGTYDIVAIGRFWQAFSQIDTTFKQFKGEQRRETSPVQLWPHHFDLAMLWLSGRLIPNTDPEDEEYSDEQMNFGFSTGDGSIPAPYFYITAYPLPDGLIDTKLPADAFWQTEGFTGAIMMYDVLVGAENARGKLLTFLRTVQQAGEQLMK